MSKQPTGPTAPAIGRASASRPQALCAEASGRKGEPMRILWMLIVGLVAGALAKLLMPGKDPGGIVVTLLLGLAGSFCAGFLLRAVGWHRSEMGAGIIASTVGAFILLAIYRLAIGRGLGRHDRRVGRGTTAT
jgi:uncharacterized membrane protein YeaQ/YmgE (transglycosylase-associated protein family)